MAKGISVDDYIEALDHPLKDLTGVTQESSRPASQRQGGSFVSSPI